MVKETHLEKFNRLFPDRRVAVYPKRLTKEEREDSDEYKWLYGCDN